MWAFFLALSKLIGSADIFSDKRGDVQALNKGEVRCINAQKR